MNSSDDGTLMIEYKAKSGEILDFNISRIACAPYGFYYSDRVDTPKGPASVVGVRESCLWFHIDNDRGASFWDNGKSYEDLLHVGISLISDAPTVVDLTDKKGVYKTKRISYNGKNIGIILQNENGPCPLISISNVLALRGELTLENEESKNSVSVDTLKDLLSALLIEKSSDKGEDVQQQARKAIELLTPLETGMDVNFNFLQTINFETTDQIRIFELLGVRLVHGWLVDPQETETYKVIGTNTYNDLMNKLVALADTPSSSNNASSNTPSSASSTPASKEGEEPAKKPEEPAKKPEEPAKPPTAQEFHEGRIISQFLDESSSQLTAYGLVVLHETLQEGEVCVFFRNNHFSTLTKHEGSLHILVTDIGYERERNIVWDLLNSVNGNSRFLTSEFKPSDDVNREEIVNTLELMGFEKPNIEETLKQIPKEKMGNVDDAISRAVQILQPQSVS